MKISTRHQHLSNELNNLRVLDHPEEFLGPNWKAVLNFWIYLDTLTEEQLKVIRKRYWDMSTVKRDVAYDVAKEAAKKTTSYWLDVYWAYYASYGYSAHATLELIGSHELLNQQKPFTFLQLFLNP